MAIHPATTGRRVGDGPVGDGPELEGPGLERPDVEPDLAPGPLGAVIERWIPPALLIVSWIVGWIAAHTWMVGEPVTWALVPTAALLALRVVLERTLRRTGPDSPQLIAAYGLHLVLVLVALVLNPLTCIYAFCGYLDSGRFLGGARERAVVVATALLCAVGQVGGFRVVHEETWFFAGLAAVNLLIALGMMHLAREREGLLVQRERSLAEISRVNEENSRLHEQLMAGARRAGAGEERTRLSREIHDTVAQGLVGVIRQLEAVGPGIDEAARHRVTVAEEAARDCLLEARRAVEALGPHQLHDGDVVEALSTLVARWARTHRVVAGFDGDDAPRDGRHAEVLVRIAQEALANIARHAEAGAVSVTLTGDDRDQILRIVDDGIGFDPETVPRGHGLENMRTRALEAGGDLGVDARTGRGCTVTARVPR
ncbi:MAG: sensor histidine kinase [Brachybacterium tyrofermentans]